MSNATKKCFEEVRLNDTFTIDLAAKHLLPHPDALPDMTSRNYQEYSSRHDLPKSTAEGAVTLEQANPAASAGKETSPSQPFIKASGIQMDFGTTHALDPIELTIREHEFFTIVGPSGCGKSTFLMLVAGLLQPKSGRLLINGKPVRGAYTDAAIAFQNHNLLEWRTVLQNILLPLEIRGNKTEPFLKRAQDLLKLVGLDGFEDHYPHQLSGGMRQRAAICRTLVCDLPLILLDEPFGALDALTREEHQMMLQRVWMQERKTVLLITHDVREAILLSDRVAIMTPRPGRILDIIDIDLPRPRAQDTSDTHAFIDYTRQIRTKLFVR